MVVLARPGTPINKPWPRASTQISRRSITASWPMITLANSARSFLCVSRNRSIALTSSSESAPGAAVAGRERLAGD